MASPFLPAVFLAAAFATGAFATLFLAAGFFVSADFVDFFSTDFFSAAFLGAASFFAADFAGAVFLEAFEPSAFELAAFDLAARGFFSTASSSAFFADFFAVADFFLLDACAISFPFSWPARSMPVIGANSVILFITLARERIVAAPVLHRPKHRSHTPNPRLARGAPSTQNSFGPTKLLSAPA
ncbi:MAG: hypothetical protein ACLPIC_17945 [Rhodoblastus sp.]|uniref:hypothetical protein n=1 Tax=Rhodoblastus sp. TaxID=1962975 RepID=UPI003F962299